MEEKSCWSCEFNFDGICAGHGMIHGVIQDTYGMNIDETSKIFHSGCDDYGISLESFISKNKYK